MYRPVAAGVTPQPTLESRMLLRAGGDGRGIPARRAGAVHVTDVLGDEDGWGNPATGPAGLDSRPLPFSRQPPTHDLEPDRKLRGQRGAVRDDGQNILLALVQIEQ